MQEELPNDSSEKLSREERLARAKECFTVFVDVPTEGENNPIITTRANIAQHLGIPSLRDRGEAHITLFGPPPLDSNGAFLPPIPSVLGLEDLNTLDKLQNQQIQVKGIGTIPPVITGEQLAETYDFDQLKKYLATPEGQKVGATFFYLVDLPEPIMQTLQRTHQKYSEIHGVTANFRTPHITIGFTNTDLFSKKVVNHPVTESLKATDKELILGSLKGQPKVPPGAPPEPMPAFVI